MKCPTQREIMFLMIGLIALPVALTFQWVQLVEPTKPLGPNNTVGPVIRVQPVAKLTTINWPAFDGTKPATIQALLHSPPGTRVPLILTSNPAVLKLWGFTTDHRGVVFDKSRNILPASSVNADFVATADAARWSDTIIQTNNEFISIRQGSPNDDAFHDWLDVVIGNGHFVLNGCEYKMDDQYVYAVGPDDHVYRSTGADHFNKHFRLIRLQ